MTYELVLCHPDGKGKSRHRKIYVQTEYSDVYPCTARLLTGIVKSLDGGDEWELVSLRRVPRIEIITL